MSKIFESHAHYEDEAFDEDREEIMAALPANDIEYVVNVGSTVKSCRQCVDLAKEYPYVYAALGIHPSEIKTVSEEDMGWIRQRAAYDDKVVAVGEIGLDYYWDKDNKDRQKEFFVRQLEMAKDIGLPVIIHSRDAAADTWEIMKTHNAEECGGVVHCFSYPKEEAAKYLDMGFNIGLGGALTFKNAVKVREVAAYVPIESILLETDCPYMAPVPVRGQRNSSLNLPYIARMIAEIKNLDYETVVRITNENARRMYRI